MTHPHHHPRHPGATLVFIPPQQIHGRPHLNCTPHCPSLLDMKGKILCENVFYRLWLSVQHQSPLRDCHQAWDPGTEHLPLQLDPVLTGCITAWCGNCSTLVRKALQRVVRTSQHITVGELPAIQDIHTKQYLKKAPKNCQRLQPTLP
jgi:hypothetical protein